jgi:type IV pilus assembly protein PilO
MKKAWIQYLLVGVMLVVVGYLLYFKPKQAELKSLREQRIQVEDQVAKLRIKKREIDRTLAEIDRLGKIMTELEVFIPSRKESSEILRTVQQLAFDSQLDVQRFTPEVREIAREYYNEWPIKVEIVGSYHNLGMFFDRMMNYPRIFNIDDFAIKTLPQQSADSTISATFTAKTYFFLDISEVKKPVPQKTRPKPKADENANAF